MCGLIRGDTNSRESSKINNCYHLLDHFFNFSTIEILNIEVMEYFCFVT